jgi:hypothetical protein
MVCPQCAKPVPDGSAFCLHCGARLGGRDRLPPQNGGGQRPGPDVAADLPAGPGGKRAYAISIQMVADERLRYRVARWLCEVAPAHPLSEVQTGLGTVGFSTFLALTPDEAEAMRQHITALGVHPALVRLAPVSEAELFAARSPAGSGPTPASHWDLKQTLLVIGALMVLFVIVGLVWLRSYGP